MEALNGMWKLTTVEKFAEFMEAISVDPDKIKQGLQLLSPENDIKQEISINGDEVYIKTITPVSTMEQKATVGVEIDVQGWDGRQLKVKFLFDNGKLVEEQGGPYTCTNVRQVQGDTLTMTMKAGSVISTRTYKKI